MSKDTIIEEYRKIKLQEELDKAMWNKYKPIKVEITYDISKTFGIVGDENIYKFTKNGLEDKYGRQDRVLRDILCGIVKKKILNH